MAPKKKTDVDLRCSRCRQRYPSFYYLVAGVSPPVCNTCLAALDREERELLLETGATAAGESVRHCLRCQTVMMRGEIAYRDSDGADRTRVRDVSWVLARQESLFLGLVTDWVVDKEFDIDAWRCGRCGLLELATDPDPSPGKEGRVRARLRDDDATLL
jgi:hypothetical protein